MFVRWSCGCIGIRHSDEECYVIKACDNGWDYPVIIFTKRDMSDVTDKPDGVRRVVPKSFVALTPDEIVDLLKEIQDTLYNGYRFFRVKNLLGIPNE